MNIGLSASAVFSQTDRPAELFRPDVDHIEVGMFEDRDIADQFVRDSRIRGKTVGIHSPLVRGGSKYDLLGQVDVPIEDAWLQIENELAWCRSAGTSYLLVHFPFVMATGTLDLTRVTDDLGRLSRLQA